MTTSFTIRPGIHFASVQNEGVVMDLIEDRYFGLNSLSAKIWRSFQDGKTIEQIGCDVFGNSHSIDPNWAAAHVLCQLKSWQDAKLVTSVPESAPKVPNARSNRPPGRSGLRKELLAMTSFSFVALSRLMRADSWARWAIRKRGISWTLGRIQEIPATSSAPRDIQNSVVYKTVRTYFSSRRLLSQGKDDCLPRSLALAMVLRTQGIDAEICFGVRKVPFAAHAWLEWSSMVVNENPIAVQKYTVLARF